MEILFHTKMFIFCRVLSFEIRSHLDSLEVYIHNYAKKKTNPYFPTSQTEQFLQKPQEFSSLRNKDIFEQKT